MDDDYRSLDFVEDGLAVVEPESSPNHALDTDDAWLLYEQDRGEEIPWIPPLGRVARFRRWLRGLFFDL